MKTHQEAHAKLQTIRYENAVRAAVRWLSTPVGVGTADFEVSVHKLAAHTGMSFGETRQDVLRAAHAQLAAELPDPEGHRLLPAEEPLESRAAPVLRSELAWR